MMDWRDFRLACHNYLLVIMDMWIPFQIPAESMEDTDKAGSKVFRLVKIEEHP